MSVNTWVVSLVLVGVVLVPLAAQAPQAPELTALETAYVQVAALAQQLARCETQALSSVKQAEDVRGDVVKRLEALHPGYTIDWTTGQLMKKP